eukprot:g1083.t1
MSFAAGGADLFGDTTDAEDPDDYLIDDGGPQSPPPPRLTTPALSRELSDEGRLLFARAVSDDDAAADDADDADDDDAGDGDTGHPAGESKADAMAGGGGGDPTAEEAVPRKCIGGPAVTKARALLASKKTNKHGRPPLHAAARRGDVRYCNVLLAAGADVNERAGKNNWTPIHEACASGRLEVVLLLFRAGADAGQALGPAWKLKSPFMIALNHNNFDIAKEVLNRQGGALSESDLRESLLAVVKKRGTVSLELAEHLLQLMLQVGEGTTPTSEHLRWAVSNTGFGCPQGDKLRLARLLLDHGADPNQDPDILLISFGAFVYDFDLPELLIVRGGADVNATGAGRNKFHQYFPAGATPLLCLIAKANEGYYVDDDWDTGQGRLLGSIRFLIRHGADPDNVRCRVQMGGANVNRVGARGYRIEGGEMNAFEFLEHLRDSPPPL